METLRYYGDMEDVAADQPQTYCIKDRFTGKTVSKNDSDPDAVNERVDRMNARFQKTEAAAKAVTQDVLNCFDDQPKEDFVLVMSGEHRTHQQDFTSLCVRWLEHLAKLPENQYDLRNKDSVDLAKALVKTEAWQEHKYLRTI